MELFKTLLPPFFKVHLVLLAIVAFGGEALLVSDFPLEASAPSRTAEPIALQFADPHTWSPNGRISLTHSAFTLKADRFLRMVSKVNRNTPTFQERWSSSHPRRAPEEIEVRQDCRWDGTHVNDTGEVKFSRAEFGPQLGRLYGVFKLRTGMATCLRTFWRRWDA